MDPQMDFKNWKHVHLPTMQYLELPWPGLLRNLHQHVCVFQFYFYINPARNNGHTDKNKQSGHHFVIRHSSILKWLHQMWIDPLAQRQFLSLRPCICEGFRGTAWAWEPGQQWSRERCRATPWVFTGGSDCLGWWFRMFTRSEGTIIHRGRGQLWIAFLPALLSLPMTPGPLPVLQITPTLIRDTEHHWPW